MVYSDNDGFLNALVATLEARKQAGTVTLTFKRSDLQHGRVKKEAEHKCLVRVNDHKRKHSTTVTAKEAARFTDSFATILKAHASALKKRARTSKR